MYYDLWTDIPKEMTEYMDYTYETHFGKPVPSFCPGPVMKDYFMGKMHMFVIAKSLAKLHNVK